MGATSDHEGSSGPLPSGVVFPRRRLSALREGRVAATPGVATDLEYGAVSVSIFSLTETLRYLLSCRRFI